MRRFLLASLAVTLLGLGLSGCSKCNDWIYWGRNAACDVAKPQQG